MAIKQSFIEELSNRADIVEVVSSYVSMKKSGANFMGLCPFHGEKTPSFSVSRDKQIFHCFGCSEGGGVISFIMKIEGLTYVDAIRHLAKMYNMEVEEDGISNENSKLRQRILEINKKTAKFYYENLLKDQQVQEYILKRNIPKNIITKFGIGYANKSYNEVLNFLIKNGYTQEEIVKSGVVSKNDKGNVYDRFRARIMFPIIDVRGEVIGFGGRVLDDSLPKYLNSPETLVFNKSYNLFALNIAKKTKRDYIILAEGYMDVVALNKAGFDNAVASLGTSFTEGHARLLQRYTKKVVIAFDSDKAGQSALNRAIDILKKTDIEIKVLKLKNAKDPDEYIEKFGKVSLENLIEKSENDTQYKFDMIVSKYDFNLDQNKIDFVKEIVAMVARLYNNVEREIFINKAAEISGVSFGAINNELSKYIKSIRKKEKSKTNSEPQILPKNSKITYSDIKSAVCEEGIISLIFTDCTLLDKIEVDPLRFSVELFRNVFIYARKLYSEGKNINISYFYEMLDENEMNHLASVINKPSYINNSQDSILDYIATINMQYAKRVSDIDLILKLKRESRSI